MPDDGAMWTVECASSVTATPDETVELAVAVTNHDPGPDPVRGSLRFTTAPPEAVAWLALATPTRTFAVGATEQFAVTVAVPAGTQPATVAVDLFMVVTDDPSTETTVHRAVRLVVASTTPWAVTADPGPLTLEAGATARFAVRVTGPGGPVRLALAEVGSPAAGPGIGGWTAIDRPERTVGAGPEDFLVTVAPPAGAGAAQGEFAAVLSDPAGGARLAGTAPIGYRLAPALPPPPPPPPPPGGRVIGTIRSRGVLAGVALAKDGSRAYVCHRSGDVHTLSVFDLASRSVVGSVGVGSTPAEVVLSADGRVGYVGNAVSGSLAVIDIDGLRVRSTLLVGEEPAGLALAPDGRLLFVALQGADALSVIDTHGALPAGFVPVGRKPVGVAVTPDGKRVYVTDSADDTVTVVDVGSRAVIATVPVGTGPMGVAIAPDGLRGYVANRGSETVSVLDPVAGTVIATVPVGAKPLAVTLSPDGRRAFVAQFSGSVAVLDAHRAELTATIPIGFGVRGVVVSPDGRRAYATAQDTFAVLDIGPQ